MLVSGTQRYTFHDYIRYAERQNGELTGVLTLFVSTRHYHRKTCKYLIIY